MAPGTARSVSMDSNHDMVSSFSGQLQVPVFSSNKVLTLLARLGARLG